MSERMKPILGALVTAYIVFYLSVTYFTSVPSWRMTHRPDP